MRKLTGLTLIVAALLLTGCSGRLHVGGQIGNVGLHHDGDRHRSEITARAGARGTAVGGQLRSNNQRPGTGSRRSDPRTPNR